MHYIERIPILLIFVPLVLLMLPAGGLQAQPTADRYFSSGIGVASFGQVDHTASRLHYRGTLIPFRLGYHTERPDRRNGWTLYLDQAKLEGRAGNQRTYNRIAFEYRHLRMLAGPGNPNAKRGFRIYGGGGMSGRFARVDQSITLPAYTSEYISGYWAASLDLALLVEAPLLPGLDATWRVELPLLAYYVKPDYSRRWPDPGDGTFGSPASLLELTQRLGIHYRTGSRLEWGLEGFYAISRLERFSRYASAGKGASLTARYRL